MLLAKYFYLGVLAASLVTYKYAVLIQDGCFGKKEWENIQQAFKPYKKMKTVRLKEFKQILEGIMRLCNIYSNCFNNFS